MRSYICLHVYSIYWILHTYIYIYQLAEKYPAGKLKQNQSELEKVIGRAFYKSLSLNVGGLDKKIQSNQFLTIIQQISYVFYLIILQLVHAFLGCPTSSEYLKFFRKIKNYISTIFYTKGLHIDALVGSKGTSKGLTHYLI